MSLSSIGGGAGQLEGFGGFGLIDIYDRRLGLVTPRLQFLERILGNVVGLSAPWGVVIGCHPHVPSVKSLQQSFVPASNAFPK